MEHKCESCKTRLPQYDNWGNSNPQIVCLQCGMNSTPLIDAVHLGVQAMYAALSSDPKYKNWVAARNALQNMCLARSKEILDLSKEE